MPVTESLRRLDDRLVHGRGKDRAAARARYLPWTLVLAFLLHFASLFTEALILEGLVAGLLLAAVITAFSLRFTGSGDSAH